MRKALFIIFLLSVPHFVYAIDSGDFADQLSLDLNIFIPAGQKDVQVGVTIYVVRGSGLDTSERMVGDFIAYSIRNGEYSAKAVSDKDVNVTVDRIEVIETDDSPETLAKLNRSRGFIALIGGPDHNNITREFYRQGLIKNVSTKLWGQYVVAKGETPSGSAVAAYSHHITGDGGEREGVKYSPLLGVVPREYVPLAATGIGLLLLALLNLAKTVIEFKALDIGKERHKERHVIVFGVDVTEFLAVFGASLVLGLSITWVYFGPNAGFLWALAVNTAVSFIAAISHELAHRLVGIALGIKAKYKFWWGGSAVTLLSGYLGNAFGVQGFIMEYDTHETKKWKLGLMKLTAPVLSIAIAAVAAKMYVGAPSGLLRTVFVTSSLWAMAEILPIKSLDGYDIKKWNRLIWEISFFSITAVFVYINFLM